MTTTHPLLAKLESLLDLTEAERNAIGQVRIQPAEIQADGTISREGDRPSRSFLLLEGMVSLSKMAGGGNRQIMMFYIAGDMPDLHSLHLKFLDSDIWAVTACRLAYMPHDDLRRLCYAHPRIADELWRTTLVDASIYRESVVNVAQRPALSRMAHLFCEMLLRSQAAGLAQGQTCPLPLTQADLGEMLGLSIVHINRMLQELRTRDLITFGQGRLRVRDWDALVELGDFRADYLHLRDR